MNNTVIVRKAIAADATAIAAFNIAMATETENKTLDRAVIEPGVSRMITDESLGFYLVAELDGEAAGCLGITFEWSDWRNGLFWWIQSVYVSPTARAQGVFSALYQHVVSLTREQQDVVGIRLYAERDNDNAIKTYHRLGMETTDYRLLEVLL